MTDNNNSITPPRELVREWAKTCSPYEVPADHIAIQAARWGADQELEACCEILRGEFNYHHLVEPLRAARRPKPPSLKEQALQALALLKVDASTHGLGFDSSAIRRALESLPD
jgi:hypothetical protein